MNLIEKAATIVALILVYRSVPADKIAGLFEALSKAAAKTQNPYDDLAVMVAKAVSDALQKAQAEQPVPKPGETVIRSTTTSIIADPAPEVAVGASAG